MEVNSTSRTDYNVSLAMSEEEINQFLNELESVFTRYLAIGNTGEIARIIEFKNLLTLSINNNN
jgi:hypothetical protein